MSTTETIRRGPATTKRERGLAKLRLIHTPPSPTPGTPPVGTQTGIDAWRRVYVLPVGQTLIGRELDGEGGIELPTDRRVSRIHARIEVAADLGVRIFDDDSKNGTTVNRRPVTAAPQPLGDGDIVRIGDSFLILRFGPSKPPDAPIPALIGAAPAMAALRHRIARLACDPASVLILGETGTGKEVVATALHQLSGRSGPRIAVNCSAIPENLAESQFFGHTANAFTGAKAHAGFFRAAHRGTLFLDEVGDIPADVQAKLLRALEEHAVTPVGATEPVPCDVRLLAATNRDLKQAMAAGQFREDLYARLADIILLLPPLRERREDLLQLLQHASPDGLPELPADFIELLLTYAWPRNVREVQKIAGHLRLFGIDDALRTRLDVTADPPVVASAEGTVAAPEPALAPRPQKVATPTKEQLLALMEKHAGVAEYAARELGCSRRQIGRWLEVYGIDRDQFRNRT